MADIAVAYIKIDELGREYIFNIAAYEEEGFEELRQLIYDMNLLPDTVMTPVSELGQFVAVGYYKDENGIWTSPDPEHMIVTTPTE